MIYSRSACFSPPHSIRNITYRTPLKIKNSPLPTNDEERWKVLSNNDRKSVSTYKQMSDSKINVSQESITSEPMRARNYNSMHVRAVEVKRGDGTRDMVTQIS